MRRTPSRDRGRLSLSGRLRGRPADHARASARSSTSSGAPTWNGTAPTPEDQGLDPELGPGRGLLPHLLDGADQPAHPPLVERRPVEDPGRGVRPQALEAPRQVRLVLAAQRVEPERSPDRRRIRPGRSHAASSTSSRSRYCLGRPRPARVPAVGDVDRELDEPVALPADEHRRARPLHRGRLVHRAVGPVVPPVERAPDRRSGRASRSRSRPPRAAGRAGPPATGSPSRSPRTRARTSRRRADVEAAAGDPVERRERLGEHRRGPQRLAEHQRPESRAACTSRASAAERRDRLERARRLGAAAVLADVEEEVVRRARASRSPARRHGAAKARSVSHDSGDSPATEKSYCGNARPMRTPGCYHTPPTSPRPFRSERRS